MLCYNLHNDFSLSQMPVLLLTMIINNHSSCCVYKYAVNKYIADKLTVSHISGLFSHFNIKQILYGPFYSLPLIVASQLQGPCVPDKLWVWWNLLKSSPLASAINDFISKDDFPTHFDMASQVEQIVSFLLCV